MGTRTDDVAGVGHHREDEAGPKFPRALPEMIQEIISFQLSSNVMCQLTSELEERYLLEEPISS